MEKLAELDPLGEWSEFKRPFRHIRAERVFREDTYRDLESAFAALRDADLANPGRAPRFAKGQAGYDAQVAAIDLQLSSQFAPLFERRWIEFLASLLDLPVLPQIDAALHHIPVNSRSGWVHNDFCSAWFDAGVAGEIVFPDRRKCDYFNGAPRTSDARPREYVRAATMILYLRNDGWKVGSGGGTGLYAASRGGYGEMSAVEPLNNSLLLFECSPHSWHALLANPGCARNSIILWLHNSVEQAQSRWGRGFSRRKPK
jgi:hypothetical protein